jgi:tetratricopeptide (TPR) repeat protein
MKIIRILINNSWLSGRNIKPLFLCGFLLLLAIIPINLFAENSLYYFSLAEMAMEKGEFGTADSLLQLAQKLDPNSIEILTERLTALYYQRKYKETIAVGKEATKSGLVTPDIYWTIADSYQKLGDIKNAKRFFKKCLKISPEKAKVYLRLYRISLNEGNSKKAEKCLNKAEEYAKDDVNLTYQIALEFGKQNNEEKFVELLQRILDIQPDFIQANFWLGNFYFTHRDFAKAIAHLENLPKSSALTPYSSLRELILSYYFTQNYDKVMECEKILPPEQLETNLRKTFFISSFRTKHYQTTISYGKQILEKDVEHNAEMRNEALEIMANAEFELQNYQNAYNYLSLIKQDEILLRNLQIVTSVSYILKNGGLLNRLIDFSSTQDNDALSCTVNALTAYFYAKCDSLQSASKILSKIDMTKSRIVLDNDYIINLLSYTLLKVKGDVDTVMILLSKRKDKTVSTSMWLGNFYTEEKQFEKAIPFLKAAIKEDSTNVSNYFILATVYNKLKNLDNEIGILETGLRHFPENAELLNWLGYTLVDNDMRLNYALTLLQKAVSIDSENVYIWDSLAWAYYKLGEYKKALESMKLVLEKDAQDTVIHYHLGNIYWKLGETESAKENWNSAIKINNNDEAKLKSEEMINRGAQELWR